MLNSTLLLTMRLFNQKERDLLELFVSSPLFKLSNRHQDAVDLHNYLKPFSPLYDDPISLQRKVVAEALFFQRSNPENELRKAMSNLQNILKKLILFESISFSAKLPDKHAYEVLPEENILAARTELAMMRFFSDRGIKKTFTEQTRKDKSESDIVEQLYTSIKSKVNRFSRNVPEDLPLTRYSFREYRELLFTNLLCDFEMFDYDSRMKTVKYQAYDLISTMESLDCLYYHLKLNMMVILLLQFNVGNPFHDDEIAFNTATNYFTQMELSLPTIAGQLDSFPVLEMYKNAFIMLQNIGSNESLQAYSCLENFLSNHNPAVPDEITKSMKAILRIYCTFMFHKTQSLSFLQKKFELTREHIDEEMLLHGQSIPAIQFTALIRDALRLGMHNFDWVEHFLQKFEHSQNVMATETPREVFRINRANLLFHRKDYRGASNELIAYEWYGRVDDFQILLLAIRIDVKTQFELSRLDDDYSLRMTDAAEKRIKRLTELDDSLKNMSLNFIRITKQLAAAIRRKDLSRKKIVRNFNFSEKLHEIINNVDQQPVAEKEWLLAKIDAVKNS